VEAIVSYVDPNATMTAHWLQSGIGPREAAAKLQPACGDVELGEETIQELEVKWRRERNAAHIVYGILGGPWNRLAGFDCKDVESPADHTKIVRYLAAVTGDQFAVDDVMQTIEPNGDLTLALTHQGNPYSFTVRDHGRWCNVPDTLDGLNGILERLGLTERFIELYTGGGGAGIVAFVRPDKFLPVARELGIRLESASDA
jgi:hypothetical protein